VGGAAMLSSPSAKLSKAGTSRSKKGSTAGGSALAPSAGAATAGLSAAMPGSSGAASSQLQQQQRLPAMPIPGPHHTPIGPAAPTRQSSGSAMALSPASAAVCLAGANTQAAALMLQQQQIQRQLCSSGATGTSTAGATALPPTGPQASVAHQPGGAAQAVQACSQPHSAVGQPQQSKGLPMSVLLEVIQQHPNLRSRIQEIVSRSDYTEPQKMAAIQRIVREKSPGTTFGASSSV